MEWEARKAVWKVRMKALTGVAEGIVLCICNGEPLMYATYVCVV